MSLIADNFHREEFIHQAADTCEYLDFGWQDILNRITLRLNVYRAQVNQLQQYIQHADAHVDHIKGSKQAIQIYSSPQYGVEKKRSIYKSIFQEESLSDAYRSSVQSHTYAFRVKRTVHQTSNPNNARRQLYDETLVLLKQSDNDVIHGGKQIPALGLGKPPANVKSVLSFLKWNTKENP